MYSVILSMLKPMLHREIEESTIINLDYINCILVTIYVYTHNVWLLAT